MRQRSTPHYCQQYNMVCSSHDTILPRDRSLKKCRRRLVRLQLPHMGLENYRRASRACQIEIDTEQAWHLHFFGTEDGLTLIAFA